jgi:hypothetical protein
LISNFADLIGIIRRAVSPAFASGMVAGSGISASYFTADLTLAEARLSVPAVFSAFSSLSDCFSAMTGKASRFHHLINPVARSKKKRLKDYLIFFNWFVTSSLRVIFLVKAASFKLA